MSEIIRMIPKECDGAGASHHLNAILENLGEVSQPEREMIESAGLREILFEPRQSLVTIVMDSPVVLPEMTLTKIETAAVKTIPGMQIRVLQHARPEPAPPSSAPVTIPAEWSDIVARVREVERSAGVWLDRSRAEFREGRLVVFCASDLALKRLKAVDVPAILAREIESRFGFTGAIDLEVGEFEPPPAPAPVAPIKPRIGGAMLMGNAQPLQTDPQPMKELASAASYAVIEGEIFSLDLREVRGRDGKQEIMLLGVTDATDAMRAKVFGPTDKLKELKKGDWVRIGGSITPDKFENEEPVMTPRDVMRAQKPLREDTAPDRRVELAAHTKSSRLSGVIEIDALVERAKRWGWKGFCVTDSAVVQAFPKAYSAARKAGLKLGLGCQLNVADDLRPIAWNFSSEKTAIDRPAIVFDLETTGLSPLAHKVIEVAAFRIEGNRITDEFHSFVNPGEALSETVSRITHITDDMLKDAPAWDKVLPRFRKFAGDAMLVAHNISFDSGFLREEWSPLPPMLDTLRLSRTLLRNLSNYTLTSVARGLGIPLVQAHRASDDARALSRVYIELLLRLREKGVKTIAELNALSGEVEPRKIPSQQVTALVKDERGLKNLYTLVTASHLEHLNIFPRVPATLLARHREGLLLGSSAVGGPVVDSLLRGEDPDYVEELARRFDYLEVGPPGIYGALLSEGSLRTDDDVRSLIRSVVELGKRVKRPVVAVSLPFQLDPHEIVYRRVLRFGVGEKHVDAMPSLHLRTTAEMLEELSFLGDSAARQIVLENPHAIFESLKDVAPIPKGFFPPMIDGAGETLRETVTRRAAEIYGVKEKGGVVLPPVVAASIEKELSAIIGNGFAVLYLIAMRLVENSNKSGFVVGSRGSVGSSVVAYLTGITEVNPLPPHWRCAECHASIFPDEGVAGAKTAACGPDLAPRECCGREMQRDGYRIPFEAFMGFEGNKVPDIDLNFAGEYQPVAMAEIEKTFGRDRVFRAGTINTLKERNALGYVKKYAETFAPQARRAEIDRLAWGITDVARTTGQHPGGIVIVPRDREITDFMPVQRPADSQDAQAITTHFDFHSYEGALVKVDVLGHDSPTVFRILKDLTGVDPMTVPLADPKVLSLFSSPQALDINAKRLGCPVGTLAIPEFGTPLLLNILRETKPTTVEELIRISGLSHGTGVWQGNAEDLIKKGVAKLSEVIATREDIMNELVKRSMDPVKAYAIMEKVRKGKGLAPEDEALMKTHRVAGWAIDSCRKIKYMFPRAHAVAYVLMALRIAWFKVYRPAAFYAAYFTVKVSDFALEPARGGEAKVSATVAEIRQKEQKREATAKEQSVLVVLEVVREMLLRGVSLLDVKLGKSDVARFLVEENAIRPPLVAVEGLGDKVAARVMQEFSSPEVRSVDDLVSRSGLSKPLAEKLRALGAFGALPESNQLALF